MNRLPIGLFILLAGPAQAAVCTIPGAHLNLQAAINDSNCSTVQFGPGQFEGALTISRNLDLTGSGSDGTTLNGNVSVSGNSTVVYAQGFKISGGCLGSWLISSGGGSLQGSDLLVELTPPSQCHTGELIFKSGFEASP